MLRTLCSGHLARLSSARLVGVRRMRPFYKNELTILLVVLLRHPFHRELDFLVRDFMAVKKFLQKLQGLRAEGVPIFPKYLRVCEATTL